MRGRLPARPLTEVADAAIGVFTAKGYRPAGISDVAKALGLSHGAVYTYAESKQALLYLALLRVLDPGATETLTPPVAAPSPDRVVALLRDWAATRSGFEAVAGLLARPTPAAAAAVESELAQIVDAIYGFVEDNRTVLQLFARCSDDLPDLAQWYYAESRRGLLDLLAGYLSTRIDAGLLTPVPDITVAARFVIETVAWFAMHRHGDPDSALLGDEECRRTVRALVTASFLLRYTKPASSGAA